MADRNIILIGMPGAGKSTVGTLLADHLDYAFVDTDDLIGKLTGRRLQDIVDRDGPIALRKIEEEVLLSFNPERHVVSTGGSAIYSHKAMEHPRTKGIVIFLDVDLETLKRRIGDFKTRGIAIRPGQSFEDLFNERLPLYERHAHVKVDGTWKSPLQVRDEIVRLIRVSGN